MSTIVTRAAKGSALTHNEVDANFVNLNTDKVEKSGTDTVVINVNSATNALRITQTGTGNAFVVEDSTSPDSSPFVVDASGSTIVGASALQSIGISDSKLQVIGSGATDPSIGIGRFRNDGGGALLAAFKGRGSLGTFTTVNNGDTLFSLNVYGADGTAAVQAAQITAQVDGTPGTNDMPGRLVFSTTADGASAPTERMRLDSAGNLKFNSGYGSVATAYGCRAWVNFNGTGTVAIRASGNVSSITDNGVGDYTVNFATAMVDANYAAQGLAGLASAVGPMYVQAPSQSIDFTQTTTAFRFGTASAHSNGIVSIYRDTANIFLSIFR
jgi:hypothetical protein